MKSALNLRPIYRQRFFDRGRELLPSFVQSLEEIYEATKDAAEAASEWQRRWGLEGCDWIAESAVISLGLSDRERRDRGIVYALMSPAEPPADYELVIRRSYYRTGSPENFKASVLAAASDQIDAFIAHEHPAYKPVPAPAGDMLAGLDALILRVCLRMSPANILRRLYPGQAKRWEDDVQRSIRRAARILDVRIPSAGRPKSGKKK